MHALLLLRVESRLSAPRSPKHCGLLPLLLAVSDVLRHRFRLCEGVTFAAVAAVDVAASEPSSAPDPPLRSAST